jgi:hypothetical protein
MTDSQRDLVAGLVRAIAMDLAAPVRTASGDGGVLVEVGRSSEDGHAGQICSWAPVTHFETAVSELEPFGVFEPTGNSHRLCVNVNEVDGYVLAHFPDATIDLHKLIAAFLGLACDQCGTLSSSRNWFTPREEYLILMRAFAEHGYAGQLNGRFRWTDKVGAAMFEACRWNEEKEDHEDLAHGLHERMWNSMPASAKLRYFLGEFDPIAAGGYVGQCWDGEQWTCESPERSCEWWERDGATACSLFARFVDSYRP